MFVWLCSQTSQGTILLKSNSGCFLLDVSHPGLLCSCVNAQRERIGITVGRQRCGEGWAMLLAASWLCLMALKATELRWRSRQAKQKGWQKWRKGSPFPCQQGAICNSRYWLSPGDGKLQLHTVSLLLYSCCDLWLSREALLPRNQDFCWEKALKAIKHCRRNILWLKSRCQMIG